MECRKKGRPTCPHDWLLPPLSGTRRNTSDIDHHRQKGKPTAAIFLDITKAFDNVNVHTVLQKLRDIGILGRPLRYLAVCLKCRTFAEKVGSTISTPRPLTKGLPQGSVLSPLLFNVIMSNITLPSCPIRDIVVSTSIYADDVWVWAADSNPTHLRQTLQEALNKLPSNLKKVNLHIAAEKSSFIVFKAKKARSRTTFTLKIGDYLKRTNTHRFSGVILGAK